jgi:hypothetical protein
MLMRRLRPAFLISLLTIYAQITACVSDGDIVEIEPAHTFDESILVRLIPFDPDRRDPYQESRLELFFVTGPYWTGVFTDNADVQKTFTIIDARLVQAGTRIMHYTYTVKGELSCGGQKYEINTEGSHSDSSAVQNAKREAVQNGILATTDRIRQYIETCEAHEEPPDKDQKLRELDNRRDEGIPTEAEFEVEKGKILGQD